MLVQLKVRDGAEAKTDEEKAAHEKAVEEAKKYWKKRNAGGWHY
ncbi:hypothetical protein FACS189442_0250 [Spirochaetia bacterium]|nr:hypothetical protein FACS189442_0250 [Spirochaetia bacterium]